MHRCYGSHMQLGAHGEDVPVPVDDAALPADLGEEFGQEVMQSGAFVENDKLDPLESAVLLITQDIPPGFLVLALAVLADSDRHQDGDVFDIAAPASLQVYAVREDVGGHPSMDASATARSCRRSSGSGR